MRKRFICKMIIILLLFAVSPGSLAQNDDFAFCVSLEYPENQIEPNAGYFYLAMEPNSVQTFAVTAVNSSDFPIKLYIETTDAYTSPAGNLVYISENSLDTMGYSDTDFMLADDIAVSTDTIELLTGESGKVQITLKAPSITEGEAIGAVRFFTLDTGDIKDADADSSLHVNVKSAQTIPIRVSVGKPAANLDAVLDIGNIEFDKSQNRFFFTVENKLPVLTTLDYFMYEVTDASGNSKFEQAPLPFKLAPKTFFKAWLDWTDNTLAPGSYDLIMNYSFSGNQKSIRREFSVEPEQASSLPGPSEAQAPSYGVYIRYEYLVGIILVLIAACAIAAYMAVKAKGSAKKDGK